MHSSGSLFFMETIQCVAECILYKVFLFEMAPIMFYRIIYLLLENGAFTVLHVTKESDLHYSNIFCSFKSLYFGIRSKFGVQ